MITGTYNLAVDPQWRNLQLQEVFLECDTTLAPVTINLFEIADLNRFYNVKLIISDVSNNAGTNNITINASGSDIIDSDTTNQIVLNSNGESLALQVASEQQWMAIESVSGSGGGVSEFKQATLPSPSYVTQSIPRPDLVGDAFDSLIFLVNAKPFIRLENGYLAVVDYCQSVLFNGLFIYEAYVDPNLETINGYWVAFEQDAQNPKLLNKVAELQMTQQFWDNGYNWTAKDSGDNVVKFVNANAPFSSTNQVESFITTLTYSSGVLSAVDTFFDFNGETVLSLYNSLAPNPINPLLDVSWDYQRAEYILDDDYYGMAMGTEKGWYYYRASQDEAGIGTSWDSVGFNILTGQVKFITPVLDIVANVTNFDFTGVLPDKMIQNWFNHPNGITFQFNNQIPLNNGNNVNDVTCVWSPFYDNPNEVIYINTRQSDFGNFISTKGSMPNGLSESWYWDNENIYIYQWINQQSARCILVEKFNTNTKIKTSWNIPTFEHIQNINAWANNNGLFLNATGGNLIPFPFGLYRYMYFTNSSDYLTVQSNGNYPTNAFGDKMYSTYSGLSRNVYNVGVEIDQYEGIEF